MPHATVEDVQAARRRGAQLLAVEAIGQGVQYVVNVGFPLGEPAYRILSDQWGPPGWMVFGAVIALAGLALLLLPLRWKWAAHGTLSFAFYLLAVAQLVSIGALSFPFVCLGLLHALGVWLARVQWQRANAPRHGGRHSRSDGGG